MKRMLFNATHPEELRVAIVDGQRLLDLDIESAARTQLKGNIYKGTVTRVEPSLEAAFVDYGAEKQGFLPLKEISRAHFQNYSPATPMAQVKIQDVIREKQTFLVQVEKDERGTKGAALTTFISLAGRYLVLMPNNPKGGGISRQIIGEERAELRDAMGRLTAPSEHSLIARTAGIGKSPEELQWDLDFLLQLWQAIDSASHEKEAPFLVYQESNLIVRAIRDYLRGDIQEIVIDEQGIFERATRFMEQVMPDNVVRLKHYQDTIPLFSRFQIEHQIENAYSRSVDLASGGSLVIDHTEALVTVDVNSARATKGADIEETALQTNLEAVDEIARQLRIRDMGGLIVLDLIDMSSSHNKKTIEMRLHEAVRNDRARIQVGHISRFGLLEMSRQRLRSSISESNYQSCTLCKGTGQIRNVTSSGLSLLRILEEEALKENTEAIIAEVPIDTGTFLLNEKRYEVSQIEARLGTRIVVLPSQNLQGPQFNIRRMRSEEIDQTGYVLSHELKASDEDPSPAKPYPMSQKPATPAVRLDQLDATPPPVSPSTDATAVEPSQPGLLARLWSALIGSSSKDTDEKVQKSSNPRPRSTSNRRRSSGQGQRSGGSRRTSQGRGGGGQGRSRSNDGNTNRDRNRQSRGGNSSGRGRRPRGTRRQGSPNTGQETNKRPESGPATETKQEVSQDKTGTGG